MKPIVPVDRTLTLARAAQIAIDVQSGCNLSGIVQSFAEITVFLRASGFDTPGTNTHPICRLFAEQIMHLTKVGVGDDQQDTYSAAYAACKALAGEPVAIIIEDKRHAH